jgi:hypothetical protein
MKGVEKMSKKIWISESCDRLYVLLPKGSKEGLKAHVAKRRKDGNVSGYIKSLIEMDLAGKIEWGEVDEGLPLLYEMAKAEKK